MKKTLLLILVLLSPEIKAQTYLGKQPIFNARLSFLVFPPFSPLLTLETRALQNLTVQLETNFVNTHGINMKYFFDQPMNGHYLFVGNAFIKSEYLRKDKAIAYLPYLGYGYAYRFGKANAWTLDSRLGIGPTTNADKNIILPVIKTGIGKTI
jgi:hypothetical protein